MKAKCKEKMYQNHWLCQKKKKIIQLFVVKVIAYDRTMILVKFTHYRKLHVMFDIQHQASITCQPGKL